MHRRDQHESGRLLACLTVSAFLHLVVVASVRYESLATVPAGRGGVAASLQVSLLQFGASVERQVLAISPDDGYRVRVTGARLSNAVDTTSPQVSGDARTKPSAPERVGNPTAPAIERPATGSVFGPWYFSARYLHRRVSPLKPVRPAFPPFTSHISGRVVLLLFINELGGVDSHRIVASEPVDVFDASVAEAFLGARYAPGLITGHAVKSQLLVEVSFEPGEEPRTDFKTDAPN